MCAHSCSWLFYNTCCGCVGSFGCFSKNQSKPKFILVVVGIWSQFHCEKQIITHYALFQCKYVLAQMNLSQPFYMSRLNFRAIVKKQTEVVWHTVTSLNKGYAYHWLWICPYDIFNLLISLYMCSRDTDKYNAFYFIEAWTLFAYIFCSPAERQTHGSESHWMGVRNTSLGFCSPPCLWFTFWLKIRHFASSDIFLNC